MRLKRSRRSTPKYNKRRRTLRKRKTVTRRDVKRLINKNIETKTSQLTVLDGTQIAHNNFITLTNNLLNTGIGPNDIEDTIGQRIGDKINLRGVSLKFMLELNERYSDVTFRILVVKCAHGDIPTRASLFNGESGNKMMDSLNREKYTIISQKFVKIRAPNMGVTDSTGNNINVEPVPGDPSGIYVASAAGDRGYNYISRATRMVRMWIPGRKFYRSGVVTYENGTASPKFFDFHVVCYAYSNYSTDQDVWNVGRVNEFLSKMYYKDA